MKKINLLILVFVTFNLFGQSNTNSFAGYTKLEIETENCLDKTFKDKGVDIIELKTIFENFFASGQISNSNDSIDKQYKSILSFWERPSKPFPIFKDKSKVLSIIKKLGLTTKDLGIKKQLDCFTNNYIENKSKLDSLSSFYSIGSILETNREIPDISPSLIASAIKLSISDADLKKSLYQKAIALMFCFDMALHL